jgi:small acid-soluble spore protein B (major beta-type SASP)
VDYIKFERRKFKMAKTNLDKFKMEVAQELGVTLGADRTSRENGSVGGQMVKKMIASYKTNA